MAETHPYPLPSRDVLRALYVGKKLGDVPCPSAILDVAKLRRNCSLMLDATRQLGIAFRAHVKTHKTAELTRLQVGDGGKDVRLIASTLVEVEALVGVVGDYKATGADGNVLYGVPPGASHVGRLAQALRTIGEGGLSLMIDNVDQLATVRRVWEAAGGMRVRVFLKTDSGYHRAGLAPRSKRMQELVDAVLQMEGEDVLELVGFYSHNSLSYGGHSPLEAMDNLRVEVDACTEAALANTPAGYISGRKAPLYISCGASPTALSLQNLLSTSPGTAATDAANALRESLAKATQANVHFEIHAGVYPTLDMQQVSASSRSTAARPEDEIAFTVLSEVCSTYPDRTECPEALINAGCIALAREPCKSYRGHGVVTAWNMPSGYDPYALEGRIIVDRVSQEHGLLQWEDRTVKRALPVEYGQKIQIWPNHACITGSQFGWYLIVDSEGDAQDVVQDVWVRWRGW